MATARSVFREHIGKALGPRYWLSGTVDAGSASDKLVDATRTEHREYWSGAQVLVGADRVYVRGGDPDNGLIHLDEALPAGAPTAGTAYELLKRWTFGHVDEAIDWAHAEAYPQLYLPLDDSTTTETTNTIEYALNELWRDIVEVRRQIQDSSPTEYQRLVSPLDYELIPGPTGLTYLAKYDTLTGIKLRFIGRRILTIAAADASTSIAPWQVIVPGALHFLFDEASRTDELASQKYWEREAEKALAKFEMAKQRYRMVTHPRKAALPRIRVVNTGSSVPY